MDDDSLAAREKQRAGYARRAVPIAIVRALCSPVMGASVSERRAALSEVAKGPRERGRRLREREGGEGREGGREGERARREGREPRAATEDAEGLGERLGYCMMPGISGLKI
eukprot:scaffold179589_cov30-Tisochrysis_lutea.AAC.1